METLHEVVGRKQIELENMHAEYNRLLSLLDGVVSGNIKTTEVTVNLETRSWAYNPPVLEEE